MLGQPSNKMLATAEQKIIAKVPAQGQPALQKMIHAANTILYSPQLRDALQQKIANTQDPIGDTAKGAANIIGEIYTQSGKKAPLQLLPTVALVMGFEYLDLLAKAGKVKITSDVIAQATQAIGQSVLNAMHLDPQTVARLKAKAQGAAPQSGAPPSGIIQSAAQGA